jgi:hypothetical protein
MATMSRPSSCCAQATSAVGDQLPAFYQSLRCIAQATLDERRNLAAIQPRPGVRSIARRFAAAVKPHRTSIKKTRLLRRAYAQNLRAVLRAAGYRGATWLPWAMLL